MANRCVILAELNGDVVLLPGLLVPSGAYYTLIALPPAAHAASHAAAGSDPLTLTEAQITGLTAALAAKAALAGATFIGAVSVKPTLTVQDPTNAGERVVLGTTSLGHTGFPRAYFFGGNSAADTNFMLRLADDYSSSSVAIPAGFQLSSNKDPSYTNARTLMFYTSTTLATISTLLGSGSDGTQLRIGTAATVANGAILIDTVAAGQGVVIGTSLKLGTAGTALTQAKVYTPTLTPAVVAVAGLSEQTFTVTGLSTADTVTVNGPAAAAGSAYLSARVSAADTLALTWLTTAATITPTSGTYRVLAVRS